MPDKYSALWLSHSSIRDFQQCPRAYYLNNIYRDPKNNRKIQIVSPPLSLGSAVHQVVEHLSDLPVERRFETPLTTLFDQAWREFSGKVGGFTDPSIEARYQERGRAMLRTLMQDPGPLKQKALKIQGDLPQYWFSEAEAMILCGKIDWLEYLPESDSIHIIDFKTGKNQDQGSLQLPIYMLLVSHLQKRPVSKISFWYLEGDAGLVEQSLPDLAEAEATVMAIAKQIKLARKLERFKCPKGNLGCRYCRSLEKIVTGDATYVGQGEYGKDCYIIEHDKVNDTTLH